MTKRRQPHPFKDGKMLSILLASFFIAGSLVGCLIAGQLQTKAGMALKDYLMRYFSCAQDSPLCASVGDIILELFRAPFLILVLGFTAIGLLGIPVLFVCRGFSFGFSVSCFFRLFGWSGLAPAAFLFGLQALLWVPALLVLGCQAMEASKAMLCRCMGEGLRPAFCNVDYWVRCGLCVLALILCVILNYWIVPALVSASAAYLL